MASLSDELHRELAGPSFTTAGGFAQLRAAVGGNAPLVKLLGLPDATKTQHASSMRRLQRYAPVTGTQRRGPTRDPELRQRLRGVSAQVALTRLREHGTSISFSGELIDPSGNARVRAKDVEIDPAESKTLDEFVAAMSMGDARAQERAFTTMFLEAWGPGFGAYEGRGQQSWGIGDVESLTMS